MTSDDLDKALVPIRNQLIKRNGGKIASISFGNIFGTRSLTQFLWYAWPSFVGVVPDFLYLWVSKSAALDMTSNNPNNALAVMHNQLMK
jgi:hypothetical protein